MNARFGSTTRYAAVLLIAGVALAGCTSMVTAPSSALQQQIESARTRSDHEALVKHYESEVAAARAKANEHREMGKRYAAAPVGREGGGSMRVHCNAVAASYDQIAQTLQTMATDHRRMAEDAKP